MHFGCLDTSITDPTYRLYNVVLHRRTQRPEGPGRRDACPSKRRDGRGRPVQATVRQRSPSVAHQLFNRGPDSRENELSLLLFPALLRYKNTTISSPEERTCLVSAYLFSRPGPHQPRSEATGMAGFKAYAAMASGERASALTSSRRRS